ncbi:hypothetical protein BDN71DRAFT_1506277 [Pleurotus eryngii]|uniref:Uncharacterized protein n=1 Tax=Pleurotus eryngii TaxID=5323 RepID=A0A9P5ZX60_PLEER|nr:hypothetical protein BDN71DRAFT_1506277 [Pleurotus eryngii]
MQSHITIRDASPHTTSVENSSSKKMSSDHHTTLPASPTPRTSPPTFSSFTAFANITNNGLGIFNSVNGDYVINNSTTNNPSVNSGNTLNVSTANSNNAYKRDGRTDKDMMGRG